VATFVNCGKIFCDDFIALLPSFAVRDFEIQSMFYEVIGKIIMAPF